MSHTPGPWITDDSCCVDGQARRVGTNDGTSAYYLNSLTICECYVGDEDVTGPNLVQAEANARLIAAAPDLLEACKEAYSAVAGSDSFADCIHRILKMRNVLREAIEKAEGKP
jgi:hypothetical protein